MLVLVTAFCLGFAAGVLTGFLTWFAGSFSGGGLLLGNGGTAFENEVFLAIERALSICVTEIVFDLWLVVPRSQ